MQKYLDGVTVKADAEEIKVKALGKKGELTEVGDGKITLEEFFGVNSLDEVKPIII